MATQTKQCRKCSSPFAVQYEPGDTFSEIGLRFAAFCPPCGAIVQTERDVRLQEEQAAERAARWVKICPEQYRNTDLSHPSLDPAFVAAAREWAPRSGRGLGFISESGKGKTRLLYFALQKAFSAGLWTHATSHTTFRQIAIDASAGEGENRVIARGKLDMMARVDVLLFDDLGKAPSTEAVDAEFEHLVETRTSRSRLLLWSGNGGGEWLAARLGADRGEPILRRLAEFTNVITA